jgi:UDP-N-acetylmuramoylalanine--D-glutamate ligase
VRALVILGECRQEIKEAVEKTGFDNIIEAVSFDDAVFKAANNALPGEIVLLSPACASWDMFNNFEDRGDRFREIVDSLGR